MSQDLQGFEQELDLSEDESEVAAALPIEPEDASNVLFGSDWAEALEEFDFEELIGEIEIDDVGDFSLDDLVDFADAMPEFFFDDSSRAAEATIVESPEPRQARASTSTGHDAGHYTKHPCLRSFRVVTMTDAVLYALKDGTLWPIGKSVNATAKIEFDVTERDYFRLASTYNEEVKFKGVALGFSVYLHSVVCVAMSLCLDGSVLEPPGYGDLEYDGLRFEITGRNWITRTTKCDFIIDKYAFASLLDDGPHATEAYRLSRMEDDGDASMFDDYPLSQPESPYTPKVAELFELTKQVQTSHNRFLSECVLYWLSHKKWILDREGKVEWSAVVDLANRLKKNFTGYDLESSAKTTGCAPTPFRALPAENAYRVIKEEMMNLNVWPGMTKGWSSFKVAKAGYNPEPLILQKRKCKIRCPRSQNSVYSAFAAFGLQYAGMQSLYAESLLLTKVTGQRGTYFDESCQLGIAWRKKDHSSVNGIACFFIPGRQADVSLVGKWSEYDLSELLPADDVKNLSLKVDKISVSPAFSYNNNDIHYSSSLFGKVVTTMVTSASQVEPVKRAEVATKVVLMAHTWKASSWMTTSLASECRFFTLTELAGSGDPASMLLSCMTKLSELPNNKISFPTYYYFWKLNQYALQPRLGGKHKTTALWGLPSNLLCLEKDLVLGMQWKTRLNDDKAKCTAKLLNSIELELNCRDELLHHADSQISFYRKLLDGEATKEDFLILMATSPSVPHYNHAFYSGLTYDIGHALSIEVGKRQNATEVRLHNLATDNNCWTYVRPGVIRHARVADTLAALNEKLGKPPSIYDAITRMRDRPKFENLYFIHPKGAKQSRREISQMNEEMRLFQYMQEMLVSAYTDAEPVDMMRDKQKFSKVIKDISRIARKGGFVRSEDRSFFCGYMHPEFMSLAIYQLARITHSTALVCSASILRQDRSRWIVMPEDHSGVELPDRAVRGTILVEQGKKIKSCVTLKIYEHFMQGIRALSAAAINSSFNNGFNHMLRQMFPQITDCVAATTSDDVIRGYAVEEQRKTNVSAYVYAIPSQSCNLVMMKDSTTKPMEFTGGGEFNNVAMTARGAVTQSPIHAALAVQPLTSPSIIGDVISAVSQARATLFWGDTPDLAQAALESYRIMLSARWLLPEQFFDSMVECGLWPRTLEELIGGFCPRDKAGFNVLWQSVPEEHRDAVLSGEKGLTSFIVSWRARDATEKKRVTDCTVTDSAYTLSRKLKQIRASRYLKGKLNPIFIPQISVKRRKEMVKGLMVAIEKARMTEIDQGVYMELKQQYQAPKVTVHTVPMRAKNLMPCKMGEGYSERPQESMNVIMSKRFVGVNPGRLASPEELRVISLPDEEFEKWLNAEQLKDRMCGLKFDSPMGLPLMMHHNNTLFKKGVLFNFSISSADRVDVYKDSIHIDGETYHDVSPCEWGGASLRHAKKNKYKLAFGYRKDKHGVILFLRSTHNFAAVRGSLSTNGKVSTCVYAGSTYMAVSAPDFSVLRPAEFLNDYVPSGHISFLTGSDSAVLNVGKYINTSNSTAFSIMQKIYSKFDSLLPERVRQVFRSGPLYPDDAIVLPMCEYGEIVGDKSVCWLKLELMPTGALKRAVYDVQSDRPTLREDPVDVDEDW